MGIHLKGGLNQDVKKPTSRRFFYCSALSWWLWLE
ncbi:hypothetical protein EAOG_03730 [Escherichia coli R527]|uniref:Uncharacterized protein n=1 Tax=Escherichia coli M605 TaxID=656417 RepID=F4T550_ECOLX|nr:conserved hypothetical protein [Escherichia coli M605]OSK08791.1 hypothetical protein EAOG_03730 [Escherichia coli R527]OSK39076.1 hypothetical protein EAIG_03001 [Escherichia coli B108]OSK82488.1 hypothetical protein ECZG_02631 [Escherichia coli H378]OSL73183.1 hypothetical protein EAYG_04001 [Escherichia coli TA014]